MKDVKKFLNVLLTAIYPNKCICCSQIINEDRFLCEKCDLLIERNNLDDLCFCCGFEHKDCVCKYNVYRFHSLICLFKNVGFARSAYYAYKFSKKQHYVKFFAYEMCNAVLKYYKDVHFDYICCVPATNRYGYDHSGYIAKEMSKILNIPYANGILSCDKKTKKQHRSTIRERIENTDGKYKFNYKLENACVLLVDDIKTTGATIDECAKMLLYAGADNVYCITTLGTVTNKN